MKDMKKLAAQGRNGDTRVAHLTEGEVVIPREVAELRPDLIAHVAEQLRKMGGNPREMVVGRGRVNPKTGVEEFATEAEVRAAYRQILGRDPDAEGLKYWMNDPGFSMDAFRVAAKPELIDQAYQQVLGREADAEGKNYWMNDGQYFDRGVFTIAAQPELQSKQKSLQEQLDALKREYEKLVASFNTNPGGGTVTPPSGGGGGTVTPPGGGGSVTPPEEDITLPGTGGGGGGGTVTPPGGGGGGGGGTITPPGGGVIDDGGPINEGEEIFYPQVIVYGPDGRAYASPREAIAAGVTNYTYVKPVLPVTAAGPGLIEGADSLTSIPNSATGNANNGALIANQNSQLFTRPTGVRLPAGVPNPF